MNKRAIVSIIIWSTGALLATGPQEEPQEKRTDEQVLALCYGSSMVRDVLNPEE